jgi:ABC-type Fe3+-hydroxamate transport system substrate-binding protein
MAIFYTSQQWPGLLPPFRIVSLVPSITETLYDLGLGAEVVGITKFCIHPPEWFRTKKRVGGTKNVKLEVVRALQPDLVIANKEENVEAQVRELATFSQVWLTDIATLSNAMTMIESCGHLTGTEVRANAINEEIANGFFTMPKLIRPLKVAYFIWRNPFMAAGGGTFIHDLLTRIGLENVFASRPRYPQFKLEDLTELKPDLVLLSSEPYPFKEQHFREISDVLPCARVLFADGELFSWYGSRLQFAPAYFSQCIMEWNQSL